MIKYALLYLSASAYLVSAAEDASYAIVCSKATANDAEWQPVIQALLKNHAGAGVYTWQKDLSELKPALSQAYPTYTCLVAKPSEVSRAFVQQTHRILRQLDGDIWPDTQWGILTGYSAKNALQLASTTTPLVIQQTLSSTEIALDRCQAGSWYCELRKGHAVSKSADGTPTAKTVAPDTTKALADSFSQNGTDLWITSGHATERDWMIGFRYKNGFWKSERGSLFGEDTAKHRFPITSQKPKAYLAIGNCLMGHIDGADAMALAYLNSTGVRQMVGYIHPTWYGYQGWGMLDYFLEQPGRHTLVDSFFANNIALLHRLQTAFPGAESVPSVDEMGYPAAEHPIPPSTNPKLSAHDARGLLFDRDNVALYGDPAWEVRMAPGKLNWKQNLHSPRENSYVFTAEPLLGEVSWATVNKNGSQRGGRPLFARLPKRIDPTKVRFTQGSQHHPLVADDFVLVPLPEVGSGKIEVSFQLE
jgi:hypothetical protein